MVDFDAKSPENMESWVDVKKWWMDHLDDVIHNLYPIFEKHGFSKFEMFVIYNTKGTVSLLSDANDISTKGNDEGEEWKKQQE